MSDPKTMFKTLGKIMGHAKEKIVPKNCNEVQTAEEMSKYYVEKIRKIREEINPDNAVNKTNQFIKNSENDFTNFSPITLVALEKLVKGINNKTSRSDPVPTEIIKQNLTAVLPLIQYIINSSFSQKTFPDQLKLAYITPIIKDASKSHEDYKNYRPVSSLPFLSKILEKAIYDQLYHHVQSNQLHSHFQSAYRKHHSCETAMLRTVTDIQEMLADKSYVALVLLDLSAAFDTVDHRLLLCRLENHFQIKGNALELIRSYLDKRTFRIVINDTIGDPTFIRYGVPQGSILGPFFYDLYTYEIEQIVQQHGMMVHIYADDIQIYLCFKPELQSISQDKVQDCIKDLKFWMKNSFLKLNPDKTQIKLFTPRGKLVDSNEFALSDGNSTIESVPTVKVLGITLGAGKMFSKFVEKKINICNFHIRNLKTIRKCIPQKVKIQAINSLVIPTLDYCNSMLLCSPSCIIPLQRTMNRAIRYVFNLRKYDRISPFLFKLHILPVSFRLKFKACLLAFKIISKQAPDYLLEKFELFEPTTTIEFRSGSGRDRLMFKEDLQDKLKETLSTKIISEWNKLPLSIRKIKCTNTFKSNLKTVFFKEAFKEFL